jgi:hypothetical protein
MALSLRPTGLRSPAFADWADYNVMEDGKVIGRIYEIVTRRLNTDGSGRYRVSR